jgi:hypothetical protein
MRIFFALVAAVCLPSLPVLGDVVPGSRPVTVVLSFDRAYSANTLREMQFEAAKLMSASGLNLDWHLKEDIAGQEFGELVVFKMKGKCAMDLAPLVPDELGLPLASTYVTEGELLSFGEVECDRVRQSLKRSMSAGDMSRGDMLLGRALGRVMAHELYHMLGAAKGHASEGVTRSRLSGLDLMSEHMTVAEKSNQAVRRRASLR